jgi:fumarate reductase subunit C
MNKLPFGKRNYQLMTIGVILLVIGFTIMALDKEPYGFGFMGITLSPIIVLSGFITEIFAILHTPKEKQS